MNTGVLLLYSLLCLSCGSAASGATGQPLRNRTLSLAEAYRSNSSIFVLGFSGLIGGTLLKRQTEQCIDPGYVPCPNIAGKCCPAGDTCIAGGIEGGCCPVGQDLCGINICYDPDIAKCCATGYVCPASLDCVGDEFCCPYGEQRCGQSDRCYNPEEEICCEGNGKVWACALGAECCTLGGATACQDPETEQCCPGGTCEKDHTCCGKQCCGSPATCGAADGYCTAKPTPTPPKSRPSSTTPAPKISTPKLPSTSASSTTSSEPSGCSSSVSKRGDIGARQVASFPDTCETTCDPSGNTVPVLHIPYIPGETDHLVQSMCQGILQRQLLPSAKGPFPSSIDFSSGTDYLTYAGGGRGTRDRDCGCRDYCRIMNRDTTQCPAGRWCFSCDEYPPATFIEGGTLCSATCIPFSENRKQGNFISNFVRECGLKQSPPQQQIVKIQVDNCPNIVEVKRESLGPSIEARQLAPVRPFASAGSSSELLTLDNDNPNNPTQYVEVIIGEVDYGNYSFNVSFDRVVSSAAILGGGGYEYNSTGSTTGDRELSFSVPEGVTDLVWLSAFTEWPVKVEYAAAVNASSSSASSAPGLESTHLELMLGMWLCVSTVAMVM